MRSWIFRNRLRLRALYAPRIALAPGPRSTADRMSKRRSVRVERRGRHVVLRPGFRPGRRARREANGTRGG